MYTYDDQDNELYYRSSCTYYYRVKDSIAFSQRGIYELKIKHIYNLLHEGKISKSEHERMLQELSREGGKHRTTIITQLTAHKTEVKPNIDGSLKEDDGISWYEMMDMRDSDSSIRGKIGALWDKSNLYLGFETADACGVEVSIISNAQTKTIVYDLTNKEFKSNDIDAQGSVNNGEFELLIPFDKLGTAPSGDEQVNLVCNLKDDFYVAEDIAEPNFCFLQ